MVSSFSCLRDNFEVLTSLFNLLLIKGFPLLPLQFAGLYGVLSLSDVSSHR